MYRKTREARRGSLSVMPTSIGEEMKAVAGERSDPNRAWRGWKMRRSGVRMRIGSLECEKDQGGPFGIAAIDLLLGLPGRGFRASKNSPTPETRASETPGFVVCECLFPAFDGWRSSMSGYAPEPEKVFVSG